MHSPTKAHEPHVPRRGSGNTFPAKQAVLGAQHPVPEDHASRFHQTAGQQAYSRIRCCKTTTVRPFRLPPNRRDPPSPVGKETPIPQTHSRAAAARKPTTRALADQSTRTSRAEKGLGEYLPRQTSSAGSLHPSLRTTQAGPTRRGTRRAVNPPNAPQSGGSAHTNDPWTRRPKHTNLTCREGARGILSPPRMQCWEPSPVSEDHASRSHQTATSRPTREYVAAR